MHSIEKTYANLNVIDFGEKSSITSCYFDGGDLAKGGYIAFLKSGDELTPDALFEFRRAIHEFRDDVNLLYCHEDEITAEGFANPSFNAWNLIGRSTRNYNNSLFVISKSSFASIEKPKVDIDGAENYYSMLFSKGPVIGIDKVLCHHRPQELSCANASSCDENGTLVLNKYLKKEKWPAEAKTTKYPGIYKLEWNEFPKDNLLVVIVNNCTTEVEEKIANWQRCGWSCSINTESAKKILKVIKETCFLSWEMARSQVDAWKSPIDGRLITNSVLSTLNKKELIYSIQAFSVRDQTSRGQKRHH